MNNTKAKEYIIGLDIGGTKLATVYADTDGNIIDKVKRPSRTDIGLQYMLNDIFSMIQELIDKHGNIKGIGISCGGPLDSTRGIIMSPPNLPGWDDVHITEILTDRFGVPAFLQNDANACALAEHRFGAGRGCKNMIFLTFGTGIGAGLILDGKLYSGTNDMAGEVGHIRLAKEGPMGYGKAGSFEGFCSGGGIAELGRRIVKERLKRGEKVSFCANEQEADKLNAKIIGDAADEGDPLAIEIYNISGRYLGYGLSILIDILNPERIIIGSIFARSRHVLEPEAMKIIKEEALELSRNVCEITVPGLGEAIGDYASICVALDGLSNNNK